MRNALLFDFDGVIIDSEAAFGRAFINVLAESGVTVTFADFGHLLGTTGPESDDRWRSFVSGVSSLPLVLEEIERRMMPLVLEAYEELPILPGVRDLLEAAREGGWATGLGTGNRGPVEQHLERLGLSSVFDAIVRTHGSGLAAKPAPDVFLALAAELQVRPEHCLVVEDSVPGCEAAMAAGMPVIVCPTAATESCEFPEGAVRVSSLADVELTTLEKVLRSSQPSTAGIDR